MDDVFLIEDTIIDGVKIITNQRFIDSRGHLTVTFNKKNLFEKLGVNFVQDKCTKSKKGVLRGIHFQEKHPQGKLVSIISGKVLDVIVDLRKTSPTFGQYLSIVLEENVSKSIFIPEGLGHGFLSLEENSIISYKTTDYFYPQYDKGIKWNDPELKINWKLDEFNINDLIISKRDLELPSFKEYFNI